MAKLAELNAQPFDDSVAQFKRCCGALRWAEIMAASRPYPSEDILYLAAERAWTQMEKPDYLEAFAAHPMIGGVAELRTKFAATAQWAQGEQAGVAGAPEEVLQELASGNELYLAKFGYRFIICATGLSAPHMLLQLSQRLGHDPDEELSIAGAEQAKITRLRLEKLLQ